MFKHPPPHTSALGLPPPPCQEIPRGKIFKFTEIMGNLFAPRLKHLLPLIGELTGGTRFREYNIGGVDRGDKI